MTREFDVAIICAGTAGLTAQEWVVQQTDNYVIIDDGPLGTTCSRVGCMPSKALIAVANDYHKRLFFDVYSISGVNALRPDYRQVMARVRRLRDEFAGGLIHEMSSFMGKLIRKRARFVGPNTLDIGEEQIRVKRIIIATGSKPCIPDKWQCLVYTRSLLSRFFIFTFCTFCTDRKAFKRLWRAVDIFLSTTANWFMWLAMGAITAPYIV